jgi:hypothetical protein
VSHLASVAQEQWAPAVLKRGPLPAMTAEEELRAVEVFAQATLATRGAAQIH